MSDQDGQAIPGSQVAVDGVLYDAGKTVELADGTHTATVLPGLDGYAQPYPGPLMRTQTLTVPGDDLSFSWTTASVQIDVVDADDHSVSIAGSDVMIVGLSTVPAADNAAGATIFSGQNYRYGRGPQTPFVQVVPVTTGYPGLSGAYADHGYDVAVTPGLGGYTQWSVRLSRYEGIGDGTTDRQVDENTTAWTIPWTQRDVLVDVRSNAADPNTSIPGSDVQIVGLDGVPSADNRAGPMLFSSQVYRYGYGERTPFVARLPVTTGYPHMIGSYTDGGYDFTIAPGLDGYAQAPTNLARYEGEPGTPDRTVDASTTQLVFEWKEAQVLLDVRSNAADPSTSIPGSDVMITNLNSVPRADNVAHSTVFSRQAYRFFGGPPLPFVQTLPVTTGYPSMTGPYFDHGYDFVVAPGLDGYHQGANRLVRMEGIGNGTPDHVVDTTTTAFIFEWTESDVLIDMRRDVNDPATSDTLGQVEFTGEDGVPSADNRAGLTAFSSQVYLYGESPALPFTERLPVTAGYPAMKGTYTDHGYDMVLGPSILGYQQIPAVLVRYVGVGQGTEDAQVLPDTTSLVFEWKKPTVLFDVRDTGDPATSIAGSDLEVPGMRSFSGAVNLAGESLLDSQSYRYGYGLPTPVSLQVPVTTGYPDMDGLFAQRGYAAFVAPGLCGTREPPGTDALYKFMGSVENPVHVAADTTEVVFYWPLTADGVPEGADYQALVDEGICGNSPPDVSDAVASTTCLWPPDHTFTDIHVDGIVDPEGDPFTVAITSIRQDEPVDGLGDGAFTPDGKIAGASAALRQERSATGDGRVYHVGFTATDSKGASAGGEVTVCVPHDMNGCDCGDEGPTYDSTAP